MPWFAMWTNNNYLWTHLLPNMLSKVSVSVQENMSKMQRTMPSRPKSSKFNPTNSTTTRKFIRWVIQRKNEGMWINKGKMGKRVTNLLLQWGTFPYLAIRVAPVWTEIPVDDPESDAVEQEVPIPA